MNGILGMNDKSEGMYWDEVVGKSNSLINNMLNDIFISSFCSKRDDLTMWRLYGDDAKGVCLSFRVKEHYDDKNFIIRGVKYAPEENEYFKLFRELDTNRFIFEDIAEWKCFFKPNEYKIEDEYRLLCRGNVKAMGKGKGKGKDYHITSESSIINPYITLDMLAPDFPLELTCVTLGPKFPAHEGINIDQLQHLLKERGLSQYIQPSNITTYR